jgi:hypothetical protein
MGGVALVVALLTALVGAAAPADAYPGAPWFRPGRAYTENFPDPSILRVGSTYYAYATSTGGAYLPVMTSTDLKTWTPRPAYDPGAPLNSDRYFNDALPNPAAWSPSRPGVSGRLTKEAWAPGVARIGNQYVAYYSARASLDRDRFCIAVATSSSPLGPFVDRSSAPLQCDADPNGSIDPQPFVDDDGTPYLLWKSEGVPGSAPTRLWSRRLADDGTSFAAGSSAVELLHTDQAWEGNLIESPSMVRADGRLLLFYSANEYRSAAYATGYADCAGPAGPCTKAPNNPVLSSRGNRLGPGGVSAFVDAGGQLQLAYHWWNAPYTDYPAFPACQATGTCTTQGQRRLAVEPVYETPFGLAVGGSAPPLGADRAVAMAATKTGGGYWVAGDGGAVAALGDAPSVASRTGVPARAIAGTPTGLGFWVAGSNGEVAVSGDAPALGDVGDVALNRPVVGMAATPTGQGYWLVASDGGIFSFGDARFLGSTGAVRLNQPIVGMAATPTGRGYWLVASDGGIFSFGDARFSGSTGAVRLNQPIVGMAASGAGAGYWLVASDGGIFSFGDARFLGSTGAVRLAQPIAAIARTPGSGGYWLLARDGGIFTFGDARFLGKA